MGHNTRGHPPTLIDLPSPHSQYLTFSPTDLSMCVNAGLAASMRSSSRSRAAAARSPSPASASCVPSAASPRPSSLSPTLRLSRIPPLPRVCDPGDDGHVARAVFLYLYALGFGPALYLTFRRERRCRLAGGSEGREARRSANERLLNVAVAGPSVQPSPAPKRFSTSPTLQAPPGGFAAPLGRMAHLCYVRRFVAFVSYSQRS